MPQPFPSATGTVATAPSQAAALERIAAGLLREETGRAPRLDALLANGYEALRPCLPAATGCSRSDHVQLLPHRAATPPRLDRPPAASALGPLAAPRAGAADRAAARFRGLRPVAAHPPRAGDPSPLG